MGSTSRNMTRAPVAWDCAAGKDGRDFLLWIKQMIARGHPVVIGIFMNQRLFYGAAAPQAGDPDYDHIVPVLGVGSRHPPTSREFFADDTLVFSDNGLWAPDEASPAYRFEYPFGSFAASRSAANAGPAVYSLNESAQYGLAITGVADAAGDTLPVRVSTDPQAEPPITDGAAAVYRAVRAAAP